ncbi:MAG: recombinase family protein [Pseudonocardiaceae bacterium]
MARYGYARVSTRSQTDDSQLDALRAAGCERIWTDTASGKLARRPEWDKCLDYVRAGDELVVTRLSRMARSVRHLTEIAALLTERGVDLVVLKQGIDTTTPAGRFLFHVIGAMDEMLADLISEGTLEGLEAARARGRTGGRKPKLTARQVTIARQMYDEKDAEGKRRYTVAEIAETFHVSRKTIYRHLEPTPTANSSPAGLPAAAPARTSRPRPQRPPSSLTPVLTRSLVTGRLPHPWPAAQPARRPPAPGGPRVPATDATPDGSRKRHGQVQKPHGGVGIHGAQWPPPDTA